MHPIAILALVQKAPTSVLDALPYLFGMFLVLMTLTILWGVCSFTAGIIKWLMPEAVPLPVRAKAAAGDSGSAVSLAPVGPAPEIIAVIAAAVATAAGPSHRIISIRPQSVTWSKAGRQSVLSSHKIR